MKLTKEQRKKLNDMTLKERVERLEELVDEIDNEQRHIRMKEFEEELDTINDEAGRHMLWAFGISMVLTGMVIGVLITKLCI